MRTLILFRHAKAVRAHEAESDEARGLTGRGRREAALAGAAMEDAGLKPTLALVSTAAAHARNRRAWLAEFRAGDALRGRALPRRAGGHLGRVQRQRSREAS